MDRRSTSQLWMQTHSGKKFYPSDIRPADICIEDIAHALSNICRFGGHCREFYSVAQHSVHVAEVARAKYYSPPVCMSRWALKQALLHDAAEAYLGDCVTPLKHSPWGTNYSELENKAMKAIWSKFGLDGFTGFEDRIKPCDRIMLVTEARDLLGSPAWMKNYNVEPLKKRIKPWSPALAKKKFLFWFNELTRGGGK